MRALTWPAIGRRLGAWAPAGALLAWLPVVGWVIRTLATLCHELGHAATCWLFGRPAIPAFDLSFGGGVTTIGERAGFLLVPLAGAWLWLLWLARVRRTWLIASAAGFALWLLLLALGGDEGLIAAMGHGGVLAIAGVFVFRGLTGYAEHYPGERHLYGVIGWALWWGEVTFAWKLLHDAETRALYLEGKRGIDNDLLALGGSLDAVVYAHLAVLLLGMAAAVGFARRWDQRRAGVS